MTGPVLRYDRVRVSYQGLHPLQDSFMRIYNKLQNYLVGFFQIGLVIIMKTKLAASTPGCCNMKLII